MYSTRIAVFDSSSVVLTVNNGNPIWIHTIVVANNSGSNITQTFTWNTGASAVSPLVAVIARDTAIWHDIDAQCQALSLASTPSSGVVVTVLYREDG